MKWQWLFVFSLFLCVTAWFSASRISTMPENACLRCHKGIEPIRDPHSKMMQAIYEVAEKAGFPGNDCIVCHGGNPKGKDFKTIHQGTVAYFKTHPGPKAFYPDPGSPWINQHTCGQCHEELVKTQWTSLMMTEAGKIQGVLWGFGLDSAYDHRYANYKVYALALHQRLGTAVFKRYMEQLARLEPQVFKDSMEVVPSAPDAEEVEKDPRLAAFTYIRGECQRCHLGNQGRRVRGDFRGMGCSACHIPYSNEGYYEGNDPTIPKDEQGHPLVHRIQATREAKVIVHGKTYSGIPIETCTTCHNRGRRIGVSFQGLMETAYQSPFMGLPEAPPPPKLHTKNYLHLQPDVHLLKGMLCQDCHTSLDVHSDGTLVGTTQAAVEIECSDCHGTPSHYPWELPLGYGDEIGREAPAKGQPRGVVKELPQWMKKGTVYPPEDGYLLSARGNPIGNVVKRGNKVVVHTAAGRSIILTPLKDLVKKGKLSEEGYVAMVQVARHIDKMECYACHDTWAPQCYGCHIRIDYSRGKQLVDWVAIGHAHDEQGLSADARGEKERFRIAGKVHEERSYLRWENPPLAWNGENRVSPVTTGCQTTITVVDKQGKPLLLNHIFLITGKETNDTVLALDMVPLHSHTVQKKARSCESCHNDPKAVGLGIEEGRLYYRPDTPYVVDLLTAEGKIIPKRYQVQFPAISHLRWDWSRFLDEQWRQYHTVGHHLKGSRPFTKEEILRIYRKGVCLSCHKTIPKGDLAVNLMHHIRKTAGITIDQENHDALLYKLLLFNAWVQVFGGVGIVLIGGWVYYRYRKRRRGK